MSAENITPHRDVTNYPIRVGDTVVYSHGGRYHGFGSLTVIGFTPKMVRLGRLHEGDFRLVQNAAPCNMAVVSGRPER